VKNIVFKQELEEDILVNEDEIKEWVQVMSKILLTHPPSYRHILSAWNNVPLTDKTIKLLTSRLVNEESKTKQYNQGEIYPIDQAFFAANLRNAKALPAHSWNPGTRGSNRGN
jgi:hypothetical protein